MRIDTHVHFWEYEKDRDKWMKDMKILHQDYLPQSFSGTLSRNGMDGCIAVQASQTELETHFLVELANSHSIIKGVVGWVGLKENNIADRLQYFSQYPIIKGWRHVVEAEPETFLSDPGFLQGVGLLQQYDYTYDLLVIPDQLKAATKFASSFPDTRIILDHCGKPAIASKKLAEWEPLVKEIAALPNVYCKLSGLLTEAKWKQWSAGEFYPYLDVVFKAFGPDRLMFGSDWPVMLVSGIYVQWVSLLEKYMENFDDDDREKVFGSTARRVYKF